MLARLFHPSRLRPLVSFNRKFAEQLLYTLTICSILDSVTGSEFNLGLALLVLVGAKAVAGYCDNDPHSAYLLRDADHVDTDSDGTCTFLRAPGSNGAPVPFVVSYDKGLLGNVTQRILQHCPNISSWTPPDDINFFNMVENYCATDVYREQAATWIYQGYPRTESKMTPQILECIRQQIGCNPTAFNSLTTWFQLTLIGVALGLIPTGIAIYKIKQCLNTRAARQGLETGVQIEDVTEAKDEKTALISGTSQQKCGRC